MAMSKKYAGLPDLDAAPEIYETPDLADDVSTVPTGTVRTISPSPSSDDETRPGLDRQPLDRDGARRRFEPSIVNAKDVNFSDAIGGTRRAYRTRSSRRRRRRLQQNGVEEVGDLSESEEETLGTKLARLKREAEEVKLELERRERRKEQGMGDGDVEDGVERSQQRKDEEGDVDVDGVEELSRVLNGLITKARLKPGSSTEDDFLSRLKSTSQARRPQGREDIERTPSADTATAPSSNLSAVAAFSDRLTALESALGISSTSATTQTLAIIPTLSILSSQITTLSAALATPSSPTNTSQTNSNTPLLDTVSSKLKTLIAESDRLTQSRKQALSSLTDLHEKRMQQHISAASVHSNTRSSRLRGFSGTSIGAGQAQGPGTEGKDGVIEGGPGEESLHLQSQLFLDEQSSKITALYHLLPTIQDLQPLLPVVLERLRTLSVIHTGAARAKGLVDDLESRQREMKEEVGRWREAVEVVEKGMDELEGVMRENVTVLGGRVRSVEERVGGLRQGR